MVISDNGLKHLKALESCELSAYPDPGSELGRACSKLGLLMRDYRKVPRWQLLKADPVTIGWGHTGGDYRLGDTIDQATADTLLRTDLLAAQYALFGLELNQNQFDALVSFVFNIGNAAFKTSDVRKFLLAKDYAAAAQEIVTDWHRGNGVAHLLDTRRKAERALFLTPVDEESAA